MYARPQGHMDGKDALERARPRMKRSPHAAVCSVVVSRRRAEQGREGGMMIFISYVNMQVFMKHSPSSCAAVLCGRLVAVSRPED